MNGMVQKKKPYYKLCIDKIQTKYYHYCNKSSLVANLGAANKYKKDHFDSPEIQAKLNNAQFLYSSGFFLTVSPDTVVALGEHACANNKVLFFFNLIIITHREMKYET
jgi:hypothetical protein